MLPLLPPNASKGSVLDYYAALGNVVPAFRGNMQPPSSRCLNLVVGYQEITTSTMQEDCKDFIFNHPEDEISMFFRNARTNLLSYTL